MKSLLIAAAACALAASLSACSTLSPFAVDTKATAQAQQTQAEAKAEIDKEMIARLDHCALTGQWQMGAGGIPATAPGFSLGGGVTCPAKPWDSSAPTNPISGAPIAPAPAATAPAAVTPAAATTTAQ